MSNKHPDERISPEYEREMQDLARFIDGIFNGGKKGADRETGFVLMVFPYGSAESGRVNYISNGPDRKDIVSVMKEMIARFEGQPESKGGRA